MILGLPGMPKHMKVGQQTACGIVGAEYVTEEWREVECRRCRRTRVWKTRSLITTNQMKSAPPWSVFVWCNDLVYYPIRLSKRLGREDLEVRPLSWLRKQNVAARRFPGVVVDHAAKLDDEAHEALDYLRSNGVAVLRDDQQSGGE